MNQNEKNNSKKCGSKDHIKGICCNVKNCVHHDCDTYCTAEQIGPSSATSSAETVCATFKERK